MCLTFYIPIISLSLSSLSFSPGLLCPPLPSTLLASDPALGTTGGGSRRGAAGSQPQTWRTALGVAAATVLGVSMACSHTAVGVDGAGVFIHH